MLKSRELSIGNNIISDCSEAFLIAEIGCNHQGNLDLCKKIIDAARDAGANAIKLQKRNNKDIYTSDFYNQAYESKNSFGETYGIHRENLELSEEDFEILKNYTHRKNLSFIVTPFDEMSLNFLNELKIDALKIASCDLTNLALLKSAVKLNMPTLLSSGGSSMDDIEVAYELFNSAGSNFSMMHCTSSYPTDLEELDLNVIKALRSKYDNIQIGFSSHEKHKYSTLIAYALGARIIEKHFTIDNYLKGSDQSFSLNPIEFKQLKNALSEVFKSLGSDHKVIYNSEKESMLKLRRKLVAAKEIPEGKVITACDLDFKVSGFGLDPSSSDLIIGRRSKKQIKPQEVLLDSFFL